MWKNYSNKQDSDKLEDFLNHLTKLKDDEDVDEVIKFDAKSVDSLIYIADLKQRYGKFEEAIKIYLSLLKYSNSPKKHMEILEHLGKTYFDAGLFSRSENTLLQILSRYPKRVDTLKMLLIIYDKLNNYQRALHVIESLEELDEDMSLSKEYYNIKIVIDDPIKDMKERSEIINELFEKSSNKDKLFRTLQNFNFSNDKDKFYELSKKHQEHIKNNLDIYINKIDELDVEKLKDVPILEELFNAYGMLNTLEKIKDFNLNIASLLHKDGREFNILFDYVCDSCKNEYPFVIDRCPNCMELLDTTLVMSIGDLSHEKINNIY